MSFYTPADWYWIVGGDGPHLEAAGDVFPHVTTVFSSKLDGYVAVDSADYVAWWAAGVASCGYDQTTRIDTEQNLAAVLIAAGVTTHLTP